MTIATEQGFPHELARATPLRGWALAVSGQGEEGITQIHQGLASYRATGATGDRPYYLALLAETSAQVGQIAEGLEALAEALATRAKSGVRWWEAELYRLRGELLLQSGVGESGVGGSGVGSRESGSRESSVRNPQSAIRSQKRRKPASSRPSLLLTASRRNR